MPLMIKFGTHEIDFDALPEASRLYVAQYGLNQSCTDSYASKRSAAIKEGKDEAAVSAIMEEAVSARVAAIIAGTVGLRAPAGPKETPFEREYYNVAKGALTTLVKAKGKAMPKEKEAIRALIAKLEPKFGEAWTKEAKRRVSAAERIGGGDDLDGLDDLLA
jgi:hypothetical protein